MAVGQVAMAAGRPAGRDPVRGGLAEVRTEEHGTHPLPAPSPRPAPGDGAAHGRTLAGRHGAVMEKETVTVAGVPVTIQAADGVLTVTMGRFDPAAAGGLLRVHPRFGTAAVGVYIAGENGDMARKPGHRWFFSLYTGSLGATETILLCDGCSRPPPACSPNAKTAARRTSATPAFASAPAPMNASGAVSKVGSAKSAVPISDTFFRPSAREGEGLWFLHWAGGRRGPYPSAQAAWDGWHANPPAPPMNAQNKRTPA